MGSQFKTVDKPVQFYLMTPAWKPLTWVGVKKVSDLTTNTLVNSIFTVQNIKIKMKPCKFYRTYMQSDILFVYLGFITMFICVLN